ncbi:MAG: OmpA family protein [Rubrivivax sp.]|nr:OmpA family protein [Rubrivivax sp.]
MNRRMMAGLMGAAVLGPVWAQTTDDGPVVPAAKILEALRGKDIVVDRPPRPGAAPAPAPEPHIDLRVQFTFGSAELLPRGRQQLDQLAMALSDRALAASAFLLAGHTDAVGSQEANLRLSMDRAESVKAYLMRAHDIPARRLQTIGYGSSRLANRANPESASNRRVEVRRLRVGNGASAASAGTTASTPANPPSGRLVPTPAR